MNNMKKFLRTINEELKENKFKTVKVRKSNLIGNIREEILDEGFKETVGAIGSFVKNLFNKLAGKIKEVATNIGFKFGFGIGKTKNNKVVLFNKNGDIITPELNDVTAETIPGTKKQVLTLHVDNKKIGDVPVYMSSDLSFGIAAKIAKGVGVIRIIDAKKPQPQIEGKLNKFLSILSEEIDPFEKKKEKKSMDQKTAELEAAINNINNKVFDDFKSKNGMGMLSGAKTRTKARPVEVDHEDFMEILEELISKVKAKKHAKSKYIKQIHIYAPTGWGKTTIFSEAAKRSGFHFIPIELAKVSIDVVAGFPYLKPVMPEGEGEDWTEWPEEKLSKYKMDFLEKVVKLAPSDILPPKDSNEPWFLFFDELNRADPEKMSAVMNLLLTGELGGGGTIKKKKIKDPETGKIKTVSVPDKYTLPKQIIIASAMNTGQQAGVDAENQLNAVEDMDTATIARLKPVYHGKHSFKSWTKTFALKPTEKEIEGSSEKIWISQKVPNIILSYMADIASEKGDEAPFLEKVFIAFSKPDKGGSRSPLGGGGMHTTEGRVWELISNAMFDDAYNVYDENKEDFEEMYLEKAKVIMKKITSKNPNAPKDPKEYVFAAFFSDPWTQENLLSKMSGYLGDEGEDIINKIIRSYRKKGQKGMMVEMALLNYKELQKDFKENFSKLGIGTASRVFAEIYLVLKRWKTVGAVEKVMKENKISLVSKVGVIDQIWRTIAAMYKDLNLETEELASFAHLVYNDAKKEPEDSVIRQIHQKMAGKWPAYEEALKHEVKTVSKIEKELKSIGENIPKSKKDKENA